MYTFIVQHSKTGLYDNDSISVIHGKLQSHDGAVVKENCFAYVKNDTKPLVFKCWQEATMPVTDIQQLRKLHEKYSALLAYLDLLDQEIDKHSARLEEIRKKKAEENKEQK